MHKINRSLRWMIGCYKFGFPLRKIKIKSSTLSEIKLIYISKPFSVLWYSSILYLGRDPLNSYDLETGNFLLFHMVFTGSEVFTVQ